MVGKFISIEGGEGVGKSLMIKELKKLLETIGEVVVTREPGGTEVADRIRKIFATPPENEPLSMISEFMLMSAARSQHVLHKIKPNVNSGKFVLSDRFADSSRVYQGIVGGVEQDFIESVIYQTTHGLNPDLTLILDCDVNVCLQRTKSRNDDGGHNDGVQRYDEAQAQFHEKIRAGFLTLESRFSDRIVIINTNREIDDIVIEVEGILRDRQFI